MTNKELFTRCLELSSKIKKYRNQFISLLPEVAVRELYLEHGMHSIYEFSAKLAGLSHDTVRKVLKLNSDLDSKPILKEKFISGEVGWSKLAVVAKIATPINEKSLAQKVETMSHASLELMVKESFSAESDGAVAFDRQEESLETFPVKLHTKTMNKLRVLKQQLEKESKHPLAWEDALNLMIKKLEKSVAKTHAKSTPAKKEPTRYIPASKKREVLAVTSQLCAKCNRPAEHLHHQVPYSISKNHESLIPLCKAHHDLVHHKTQDYVDRQYQQQKRLALRL
jgi:hypothetical protein